MVKVMDGAQSSVGGVRRVLVVDDHPDTTEILSIVFTMLGCEAVSTSRGREALRLAREFDPELILLDIGLPDINGFEVVHALRAESRGTDRFIVAVTGWSRPQDIARAKQTGFDEYLVKPIELANIRHVLRLASSRGADRADTTADAELAHSSRPRRVHEQPVLTLAPA
jgi:DNA-binding response OmpR family regulator